MALAHSRCTGCFYVLIPSHLPTSCSSNLYPLGINARPTPYIWPFRAAQVNGVSPKFALLMTLDPCLTKRWAIDGRRRATRVKGGVYLSLFAVYRSRLSLAWRRSRRRRGGSSFLCIMLQRRPISITTDFQDLGDETQQSTFSLWFWMRHLI